MAYQYDVFISYRRDPFGDEWLMEHFLPVFKFKVRQAIAAATNRNPQSIFFDQADIAPAQRAFDQQGIEPGQNWRNALETAIRESRCVVALWSPLYFHSEWCHIEWRSFLERGQALKPSRDLVVPATIYDGESFPADARATQFADLSNFIVIGDGFKKTKRYVEFQDCVGKFAEKVAKVVAAAPEFSVWSIAAAPPKPPPPTITQPLL